jgi:hypothetical protein
LSLMSAYTRLDGTCSCRASSTIEIFSRSNSFRKNLAGMNEIYGGHQQLAWPLMIVTRAVPSLAQLLTCPVYLRAASIERDKMQVACYLNL